MNGTIDYSVLENEQLAKLESGQRAKVQFKPSKKMKKRRQLDALVSNGKKLPRRKNSGHELLRSNDDTESSEVEEFSVLDSQKWGRRWSSPGCCSVSCPTLTCLLLAALVVVAGTGLLWMNLTLRQTCDQLQDRLTRVENQNAGVPEELRNLQDKLVAMNRTLCDLRTGTGGLDELNKNLLSLKAQVTSLKNITADQKSNQVSLPNSNKDQLAVAKTVAELGAVVGNTRTDVQALQTTQQSLSSQFQDLDRRVTVLENPGGREVNPPSSRLKEIPALVLEINETFTHSIALAMEALNKQQAQLDAVDKLSQALSINVSEVSQMVTNLTNNQQHLTLPQQSETGETNDGVGQKMSLAELQSQVTGLQHAVSQLLASQNMTQTGAEKIADIDTLTTMKKDHEDLVFFREEAKHSFEELQKRQEQLNATVTVLNGDVGELYAKLGMAIQDYTNMTLLMERLLAEQGSKAASSTDTTHAPPLSKQPTQIEHTGEDSTNQTREEAVQGSATEESMFTG